jgi:hypothetical protein
MDRLKYREVLQSVVNRHAKFQPANGNIKTHAVCDTQNDDYMVVDSGWNEKGRRIYDVVPFLPAKRQSYSRTRQHRCRSRPRTDRRRNCQRRYYFGLQCCAVSEVGQFDCGLNCIIDIYELRANTTTY